MELYDLPLGGALAVGLIAFQLVDIVVAEAAVGISFVIARVGRESVSRADFFRVMCDKELRRDEGKFFKRVRLVVFAHLFLVRQ